MKKYSIILLILVMYVNITSFICWIKNPKLSQIEVAMRIPRSFILQFGN